MSAGKRLIIAIFLFALLTPFPAAFADQITYKYDNYGRLTDMFLDDGYSLTSINYTYDNVGNIKTDSISKQFYPQIAVSPQPIDFGTVYSGSASNQTVTITNSGGDGLSVTNLDISGTDSALFQVVSNGCEGLILPAGGLCSIDVTAAPESNAETGAKTATLAVTSNDRNTPIMSIAINAVVSQPTLTVTKQGNGAGTVTSTSGEISCGALCNATFSGQTYITLTAVPDPGNLFAGWSGDCSGSSTICNVQVDRAVNVAAAFAQTDQQFTVNLTVAGSGSGSVLSTPAGIACGADCSASFPANTRVTLEPTALQYSIFSGWAGGTCSGTSNCVFLLDTDKSVTAVFYGNVAHQVVIDSPPAYYPSITEAYGAAVDGNIIKLWAVSYSENLIINRPIGITIQGGYNEDYTSVTGESTLKGTLTITDGSVITDGLSIE